MRGVDGFDGYEIRIGMEEMNMSALKMKLVSSLEKVFLDQEPRAYEGTIEGFRNEIISFQAAYTLCAPVTRMYVSLEIISPIAKYVHVRQVEHVPVRYAAPIDSDDNYLRKTPGLYPDLLREIGPHTLRVRYGQWDTLWVEIDPQAELEAGEYPVTLKLTAEDESTAEVTQSITILDAMLPPQKLVHTKWIHCDCLADYYHQEIFSEAHWQTIERFIRKAVSGGINMMLTPIHTPPLDTRVGTERPTTQLVDVFVEKGAYRFEMSRLRRWISMCKDCGVEYFEMAHLYTQWGAKHAPKIMATVDGEYRKLFGWETEATGEAYRAFLNAYIPAVRKTLEEEGIAHQTAWHISDEPSADHMEDYKAARNQVLPLLNDCFIMDALSSFEYYQQGVVDHPVVANNHIEPFIEAKTPDLWTYYCCGQYRDVSNMFIAMPSSRNRILAAQLFKYDVKGFLQWGYNFYYAQYSDHAVTPYLCTDGDGFVPAGDPFQVYPGMDGEPEESIRMAVTRDAMQDLRAFEMLAELENREFVVSLMDEDLEEGITFANYPHDGEYLISLRRKVNKAIMERMSSHTQK